MTSTIWNNAAKRSVRSVMQSWRLLIPLLLTISAAGLCNAQDALRPPAPSTTERLVRVVESLPDGGYVIEIEGAKYRAVTDEQLRTLAVQRTDLTACTKDQLLANDEIAKLKTALALARKDAELATAQTAIERERSGRFEAMYLGEHDLRLQAEQLIKRGRVSRFFDKPITQIALKLVLPIFAALIRR